ncbi:MAG: hypothetical protein KDD66_02600 [Bdellovibrionales bacterium]|nr:hypothetical protein [Bdellovibrionales bacterium]
MEKDLRELGLSDKEVSAYVALIRFGTRTTSFVAKKTGLNRGTAYLALHGLLEKGFASKNVKNNVQYFTGLKPSGIRTHLERRKEEVEQQIQRADELIDQLDQLANPIANKPKVQFYEGQEGARVAMLDSITAQEKSLRSFLSIHDVADFLGAEFFEDYTNKRITRGPFLRTIRNRSKDEIAFSTNPYAKKYLTSRKDRREVRYLGKPIEFPMSIYLYDEKVMALSSKHEGYGLIIESNDLSSMLKEIFDVMWESCTPV